ncbi:MAG: T9SS type A sorting domain-containing protein [Bacteroidota bacterium]
MNKLITPLLLMGFACNTIYAQVTLTSERFVSIGDALDYYLSSADSIDLGLPGTEQQTWDFTHLSGSEMSTETYESAALGTFATDFPDANILQRSTDGREDYLEVNATSILSHGYVQEILGEQFPVRYEDARIVALNPTNFGDVTETTTEGGFAISLADYPLIDSLLNSLDLGEINGVLDSLRFRSTTIFRQEADAWGTCRIPGGEFEVLRIAQVTEVATFLEIHLSLGPLSLWIDLANFFDELEFEPFSSENAYLFVSPDHKETITNVQLSPLGTVNRIEFAAFDPTTSTDHITLNPLQIRVFPNPTQDWLHLQTTLSDGVYQLGIYDTQGKTIELTSVSFISGVGKHELVQPVAGLYFFQLLKADGHIAGSGRFLVNN